MRVVVPSTVCHPEVIAALAETGWEWDSIPVDHSDRAYYDLLASLWADGQTFVIVEHDIVIHPDTLDELADCDHDWCSFPFRYGNTITHGLGCVKFGAALIERNPDAMLRVGVMFDAHHAKRHWCRLDAWLQGCVLLGAGEIRHEHETVVGHLGNGCAHGCAPTA